MSTLISQCTDPLGYTEAEHQPLGTRTFGGLYTEPSVLERERSHVFHHTWSLVADSEELAQPGAYTTVDVQGMPLAIVRHKGGTLRAFHNICRHRGITLLEGSGTLGRFVTCPYHQWSYGPTGELITVPQQREQFDDMDKSAWSLYDAPVAEWQGMVFVNPSPDAPPLHDAMAGLSEGLNPFLAGPLRQVAKIDYEVHCNWKLMVENHIDVYHLWYLHARSLAAYAHPSFAWESMGENWRSLEPLKDPTTVTDGLAWIPPHMQHRIGAYLFFPNLMLVTTDHYFATYDAQPITPDRTNLTLRVRSTADADADGLVASIRSFMAEDVVACERMQDAATSPRFGIGPMASTHEEPIHRFHRAMRRRLFP